MSVPNFNRILSPEARLVLQSSLPSCPDVGLRALASEVTDWRRAIALSMAEGANPLFARSVRRAAGPALPPEVARSLLDIERTSELRQGYLRERLEEAVLVLVSAGIPVVLLKGAGLVALAHRGFSERPMGDLDLLVPPERTREAFSLLLAAGWSRRYPVEFDDLYARMHHLPPLVDERTRALAVGVELHTDIVPPDQNPFAMSAAEIWKDSRVSPDLPPGVRTPSTIHFLLHSCIHFAWSHRMQSAGWRTFRDVHAITSSDQFDWDHLVHSAERFRCRVVCFWTLRLAHGMIRLPVPDAVLDRLRPARAEATVRLLERHLVDGVLESESRCPSTLLRAVGWRAAMRLDRRIPRALLHARNDARWEALGRNDGEISHTRVARKVTSPAAWIRYMAIFRPE